MAFTDFRQRLEQAQLDPDMRGVCLEITDMLSEIELGDGYHLSLHFFAGRLADPSQAYLIPALSILCTMEAPVLSMHGYLNLDEGQHHLSNEEFGDLVASGNLSHPDSGELIPDPLNHVRIFYSIRDDARDES